MKNLATKAFNDLTDKQRQVWTLVMRDCLTETAAGRVLAISRDAVHNRLRKAKVRYAKYIRHMQRKESNYA